MKTLFRRRPRAPLALTLVSLLGLALPALAQSPDGGRGPRPGPGMGPGSGPGGGYAGGGATVASPRETLPPGALGFPGQGPHGNGPAPAVGQNWDRGGDRGARWNDGRGPSPDRGRDDRRGYGRDDHRWSDGRDHHYRGGYAYGGRGYGYAYGPPPPPVRYAYVPPPRPIVWGPAYYAPGVVIPVDAWGRRHAPPPYVYQQYAQPGAVPVVIDGTLFLVDAITRTILDVITGGY